MDFKEYMATTGMDEQTENSCAWKFYKELYRVGQQSKQAEIDRLKMSNHHLSVQVLDAEAYSDYWQKNHDRLQAEIDALQEKISKVLYAIAQSELHGDRAIWGIQDEIKEILK